MAMTGFHYGVRWRDAGRGIAAAAVTLAGSAQGQVAPPRPNAPVPAAARPAPVPAPGTLPPGMQYLYGSGEGAAIGAQAWHGLVSFVREQASRRSRAAGRRTGVVLARGSTLARPVFRACGSRPLAAVFDIDETVLLNLGFEADDAAHPGRPYDAGRWSAWERGGVATVAPVPGAADALRAIRAMGVRVVFNTNRSAANADATAAALDRAGLGPAVHRDTLYLAGDDSTGSRKDERRAAIAGRFCVVAMVGDQLGDFSDLFNASGLSPSARRIAALSTPLVRLWGAGWFLLPNPVYGTALRGGIDDVFPTDRRWTAPHD